MTYVAKVEPLASASQRVVLQLHSALLAGQVSEAEFTELAARVVAIYNARASAVADVALVADLARLGVSVEPVGGGVDDSDRLGKAFATLVATGLTVGALRRIGRAEPLGAAQDTYSAGLKNAEMGWTRVVRASGCKVCRDLAGPVLPPSVAMYHHPGCTCSQRAAPLD